MSQTAAKIADARRLYHHMLHQGKWSDIDTRRLSGYISQMERMYCYLTELRDRTPHAAIRDEINQLLGEYK